MLLDSSLVHILMCIGMLIRSCHCECVLVIYDLVRKVVRKTPVSEYVLRVGRLGHPHFQGGQWVDIIGQWSPFAYMVNILEFVVDITLKWRNPGRFLAKIRAKSGHN